MATKPTYVTLREAAATLGVHESTVRRYADRGLIHAARLPSGVRRLRRSDVDALQAHAAIPNPAPPENTPSVALAALAAAQGIEPLHTASELADPEVWRSDEEVELFNAATRFERERDR